MSRTSFDVRIWETRVSRGARGPAYQVRWVVGKSPKTKTFGTSKLAESFRSKLLTASRSGEAFDISSGLPASMTHRPEGPTWLQFAMDFVDVKWDDASPNHRKSTAEGLVTITMAMMGTKSAPPDAKVTRAALMHWCFNAAARQGDATAPQMYAESLAWLRKHTRPLADLAEPEVVRLVLKAIGQKIDGTAVAASVSNRKRAALSSALAYAIELGHLSVSPLKRVKVKRRKVAAKKVRAVLNHEQALTFLAQVQKIEPALVAYFGSMYYAAMRPGEARNVKAQVLDLPTGEGEWGTANLANSYQEPGKGWSDNGEAAEERELKHRLPGETRPVPLPPQLVELYRFHMKEFGIGPGGRLFVTRHGPSGRPLSGSLSKPVSLTRVGKVFRAARETLGDAEQAMLTRPYDLRHACVSTWLAAGADSALVAEWAGHSLKVLLDVYAHAVEGRDQVARDRIAEALRPGKGSRARSHA